MPLSKRDYLNTEQIQALTDEQLGDTLEAVFDEGFEAEQDPTIMATEEHKKLVDFFHRLIAESKRRLDVEVIHATE